jgi:hypothetical protein
MVQLKSLGNFPDCLTAPVAFSGLASAYIGRMNTRPQKIMFGDMRDMGVRGVVIYCEDYRCSHSVETLGKSAID